MSDTINYRERLEEIAAAKRRLIEAYTNQIVILHEPDQESKFPSRYETRELYVDKNSQGRKGKVLLQHVEGQFRFESGRL